jgi:hypothetical protein
MLALGFAALLAVDYDEQSPACETPTFAAPLHAEILRPHFSTSLWIARATDVFLAEARSYRVLQQHNKKCNRPNGR